ncbi:glutamate racemase [Aquisalimonas lutea]|uniref:glutamate racemase n=1 Tax=Aquisalimonas lutea TaxID=1327750 RepID=UPI0025B54E50|nr:glutamate racemase [Aquisalimonas lutea]MDN3517046.1 glutamate racemase [Aquisalimonas lutea]
MPSAEARTDARAQAGDGRNAPIGVFDSGLGGLSVLRAIRTRLPAEDLLYAADAARVPYGSRSAGEIRERALVLAEFLVGQGAKALVIACNTATAVAADALRERFPVPVVAMEPAIKPAVASTRTGVVGVLATEGTLSSARFAALLEQYAGSVRVVTQPCPGLVAAVEAGETDGARIRGLLEEYLQPLEAAGADTVILGCTHYPFLVPALRSMLGPEVILVETGAAVARQLERRLAGHGLLRDPDGHAGSECFWTTGDAAVGGPVLARLWGGEPRLCAIPEPGA